VPPSVNKVIKSLQSLGDRKIATHSQRFFKTGPGEYGEGDIFLGIRVPVIRQQVKKFKGLTLEITLSLLKSNYHEVRLFAVLMLVDLYQRANSTEKNKIYHDYLNHSQWINNWDLVDSSAHKIVGVHLLTKSREPLYQLTKSALLWDRRIAMIACYHFIKNDDFEDAFEISLKLLDDSHDLIHKAVGWMLREIGKRNFELENRFLKRHYQQMPRTMLRYAIEKFPETLRQDYLKSII